MFVAIETISRLTSTLSALQVTATTIVQAALRCKRASEPPDPLEYNLTIYHV
jgi:hypothetical protein